MILYFVRMLTDTVMEMEMHIHKLVLKPKFSKVITPPLFNSKKRMRKDRETKLRKTEETENQEKKSNSKYSTEI